MISKTYSLSVASLGLSSDRPSFYFNSAIHNIDPILELEDNSENPLLFSNGFNGCSASVELDTFKLDFKNLIQNNALLSSIGESASIIMDNNIFLNEDKFKKLTGGNVFGCSSLGYGPSTKVAIMKRTEDSIGIEKLFKYVSYENIDRFSDNEFTEISVENKFYCVSNLKNPINICNLLGSNRLFSDVDMLNASFDYKNILNENLSEWQFLDLCEYVPVNNMQSGEYSRLDYSIDLYTKYFPIYKHFAVIGNFRNGLCQLSQSDNSKVDCRLGLIKIDAKNTDIDLGELDGIYIFYSVLPICFSGENINKLNLKKVMFNNDDIIKIGINNKGLNGNIYLSENTININKETNKTSESVNIKIPAHYKKCFIECDSQIIINGNNLSSGSIYIFDNIGENSISISPPDKLYSMLKEVARDGNFLYPHSNIQNDTMAIYGLFTNGNNERFSLMSISNPFRINDEIKSYISYGNFEEYSATKYSDNFFGTKLSYSINQSDIDNQKIIDKMEINVTPKKDGYHYVLPAWTTGRNISVYNASDLLSAKKIDGWKFIEPDILILDKKNIDIDTYRIVFSPIVNPIISEIDFINNRINVHIDENKLNEYNNLSKILILTSHRSIIRIGFIDDSNIRHYFDRHIYVNIHITPNYLHKSITGFKTILY